MASKQPESQTQNLKLDRELYEQVRELAEKREQTIKTVGQKIVAAGLEAIRKQPTTSAA